MLQIYSKTSFVYSDGGKMVKLPGPDPRTGSQAITREPQKIQKLN